MKIGPYTLRKPWVKMVDMEFPERVYREIRASIVDDIIKEVRANAKYKAELFRLYREKE